MLFCVTQDCQKGTERLLPRLERLPWALVTWDLGESVLEPRAGPADRAQGTRQQHSFAGVCWFGLQMERRCRRRRFSVVSLGTDVLFRTVTAL